MSYTVHHCHRYFKVLCQLIYTQKIAGYKLVIVKWYIYSVTRMMLFVYE